jgi:lipocalin
MFKYACTIKNRINNYQWYLKTDLQNYAGKWVAIADEKVVAADTDLKRLTKEVTQQFSLENISFAKCSP